MKYLELCNFSWYIITYPFLIKLLSNDVSSNLHKSCYHTATINETSIIKRRLCGFVGNTDKADKELSTSTIPCGNSFRAMGWQFFYTDIYSKVLPFQQANNYVKLCEKGHFRKIVQEGIFSTFTRLWRSYIMPAYITTGRRPTWCKAYVRATSHEKLRYSTIMAKSNSTSDRTLALPVQRYMIGSCCHELSNLSSIILLSENVQNYWSDTTMISVAYRTSLKKCFVM